MYQIMIVMNVTHIFQTFYVNRDIFQAKIFNEIYNYIYNPKMTNLSSASNK